MTPERLKKAVEAVSIHVQENGTVREGGVIYPSLDHSGWTNLGGGPITDEEIEWMEAVLYEYGQPWGG